MSMYLRVACRSWNQVSERICFKDLTAASLAEKVPERIECRIHVIRRMIGADLETDFLIAVLSENFIRPGLA